MAALKLIANMIDIRHAKMNNEQKTMILLLKALFKRIGKYDVLVSTATGGERAIGPFLSMNMQGYRNSFDKLWGYANVVRYGVKNLSKSGNIVLVSGSPARKPKPG